MSEHYTKNTEEVTAYCRRCQRNTQHRVFGGRLGPCIDPEHGSKRPQPGDRPYRVIYLQSGEKKHRDFGDFNEALNFFARFGPQLATLWQAKEQLR
jgi:hypothetical protein